MKEIRTGTPPPDRWGVDDIMAYLSCERTTAESIMEEYHNKRTGGGYGAVDKHLILGFIEEKQRQEREREARYKADLATAESFAVLKEQVKTLRAQNITLREMCDSSSAEARKARTQSMIANFISGISVAIAILALVLNLN